MEEVWFYVLSATCASAITQTRKNLQWSGTEQDKKFRFRDEATGNLWPMSSSSVLGMKKFHQRAHPSAVNYCKTCEFDMLQNVLTWFLFESIVVGRPFLIHKNGFLKSNGVIKTAHPEMHAKASTPAAELFALRFLLKNEMVMWHWDGTYNM